MKSEELRAAVAVTMQKIRGILSHADVSRPSLEEVKDALCGLAARKDLLPLERFGLPAGHLGVLYKLAEDPGGAFTLYVNRCGGGLASPPHDHQTWAVIAAVHGTEINRLYSRTVTPDGSLQVTPLSEIDLSDGQGLALMPDDVHSIRVEADSQLLNLHLYGTGIDRQSGRRRFDSNGCEAGHYAPQPLILPCP